MQLTRFSNYKFKNEKTAQNRVVIPPMASQTADLHGFVTEQTVKHYEKLGLSQAGLVFVEYTKKVDFAAVGRAILKDPLSWGLANIHYQQKSD